MIVHLIRKNNMKLTNHEINVFCRVLMNSYQVTILTTASVTVCVVVLMPQVLRSLLQLVPAQLSRAAGMASSSRSLEEFSMAFVTAPNSEKAKEIAGGLVRNKLAACVNIIPGMMII